MSDQPLNVQFTTRRRVEFCETDMAGIVHFANYYRYMEQAEHAYFQSLGLSVMETMDDGTVVGWPRVSCQCRFLSPAFFEDELEIRVSVDRIGVKSLTLRFEFWREDVWIASGRTKNVCCVLKRGETMRSIEIPSEYRDVIHESDRPA